jgi:hypothetical protein
MIYPSVNRLPFMVRLLPRNGLYSKLVEIRGLTATRTDSNL